MLHGLHALMDQEYTGDINIMPSFRLANPLRLLSHLNEEELIRLTHHGAHACYEKVRSYQALHSNIRERWKIFFIDTNTVICVPIRLRSGRPVPRVADQLLPLHSAPRLSGRSDSTSVFLNEA